jgi:hypothetical protein
VGQAAVGNAGAGKLKGDFAAGEVFELADQVALATSLVDFGRVKVGAEVVEAGVGI